jgi:hypothetical protein
MFPMVKYGIQQGYQFEGDLRRAINVHAGLGPDVCNPSFLLSEHMIKEHYGMCLSSNGRHIIGVDILCVINGNIYAIQCKQYSDKVPKQSVQDFVDYCNFLERIMKRTIIKIWSSSQESTGPGNILGNENSIVWIIFPNTRALITNTVSWLFERKYTVDHDCDCLMN